MQKFKKTWNDRSVEDWGCYMSKEAKSFVTAFRNMLKRELEPKGFKVVSIKPGHYYLSGYIEKDGRYYYVSYSIPRYGRQIVFDRTGFSEGVLYRTAKSLTDSCGGANHFCSIEQLPEELIFMDEKAVRVVTA